MSIGISAAVAASALVLATGFAQASGRPEGPGPATLALGDSLAVGVGASDPATTGYVPQVHAYLGTALDPGRADPDPLDAVPDAFNRKRLELVNLGVSGETTSTMIAPGGQFDAALATLAARNGNATPVDDVRVVTLDVGGDDVFAVLQHPDCAAGLTAACGAVIQATFATFGANFGAIVAGLRTTAGPDAEIVVMTYYNPLVHPACPFHAFAAAADVVLEGNPALGLPVGMNDIIRATAAAHGAEVAETFGRLGPADLQPDCLHANDSGYGIIRDQFVEALED